MKVFQAASPEQLAEINALSKQNKKLLQQYLVPYSAALSMCVPALIYTCLLAPGRLLNPTYESIASSEAANYLTGYDETMEQSADAFNLAGDDYLSLMKDIEARQFILELVESTAKNLRLARVAKDFPAISDGAFQPSLKSTLQSASEFKSGSMSLQQLQSANFFELLDTLLTHYQQGNNPAIRSSTALNSLAITFKSAEEVIGYKQHFLNAIMRLAGNSDHSVWSKKLADAVLVSYEPSTYHQGRLTQNVHGLAQGMANKSFRELFELLQDGRQAQMQSALILHHTQQYGRHHMALMNQTANKFGRLYAQKFFLLGATAAGMLSKSYIFDPVVSRIYNRFFAAPLPPGYDKHMLRNNEASEIINKLRMRNELLAYAAKRNIRFARHLSLITIPIFIYYAFISGDISAEFAIFSFCTFFTALSNIKQEFSDWYAETRIENELAKRRVHLVNAIPQCTNADIQTLKGDKNKSARTLVSCYFLIRTKQHQGVDAVIVCQIIKEGFLEYGIDIVSYGPTLIAIAGNSNIDTTVATRINRHITKTLERVKGITQLRLQLLKLNDAIDKKHSMVSRPQRDAAGQRINQFVLLIPEQYKELLASELRETFCSSTIEISETENDATNAEATLYLKFIITGYEQADNKKLETLISNIRKFKQSLVPVKDSKVQDVRGLPDHTASTDDTPRSRSSVERATSSKKQSVETTKAASTPPHVVIQWRSAVYDSNATMPKVTPVESRYLPRHKFFTFFALDEKDFPDDISYKQFKDKAERAKLAAQEGDEGVVFIDEMVRDKHGAFFRAKAKLKIKGTNGDMRVYAAEEQSPSGEMLYVFKGINANSH